MKHTRPLNLLAGLLSGVVGLSALGLIGLALSGQRVSPFFIGFEVVVLVASVIGVLLGRGKFADGPGIGWLCVAGVFASASLLGYLGAGRVIGSTSLTSVLLARLAAAAIVALCAAGHVLFRVPRRSFPSLVRALGFGAPLLVILAILIYGRPWLASIGIPGPIKVILLFIAAAVILGLLAACVHCVIRAFEIGRQRADQPEPRA